MAGAIRTAVVGLGYFGSFHARHHAAHADTELVAVVDADAERAAAAAAAHGALAFTTHDELIGRVDAVSVTVPTALHHRVAADFLDAGIHVLIEKPVTDDPATARDLIARAEKSGAILEVGHIERFSATFGALAAEVSRPLSLDFVRAGPWTGRAADVDVVLDLMIHDIDLALALAGAPVVDVAATGATIVSPHTDVAEARLAIANGLVATLRASRAHPAVERRIRVAEAERVLVADLAERRLAIGQLDKTATGPGRFVFESAEIAPRDALGAEIGAFVAAVATGRRSGVDGRAGLEALSVAERIRAAIAGGKSNRLSS